MKRPFAYVLYVVHENAETEVCIYETLGEAEQALRDFTATLVVGPCADDEVMDTLASCHESARIFACTAELEPFARAAKAA
jgi:hypothetical protein